jgi:uncharacterized LabA/DUF88 family protein
MNVLPRIALDVSQSPAANTSTWKFQAKTAARSHVLHLAQRVAVLVDAQNMYHSAKHLHGARLNFGKAVETAVAGRPLIRAIAYVAKSKTGEESAFFEALIGSHIEPKIKDVQEFSSGAKKADWDVGMAVDAVKLAEKVDVIILMTGDGDFVPLVEYLHGRGVMVEVAAFAESTNAQLRGMVDNFFDLSTEPDLLMRVHRGPTSAKERHMAEEEHEEENMDDGNISAETPSAGRRVRISY